jgi:CubicO group peptidase (beta-lactamase class C family)
MKLLCSTMLVFLLPITALAMQTKSSVTDKLFEDFIKPDAPGATVMVIKRSHVIFKKAYGLSNLEEKSKATTRTNYRLASSTKQFTAMAILMLVERKKLSLDDHVTKIFPDFPAYGNEITIRELLTHTSGLIAYEEVMPAGTTVPLKDKDVLALMMKQDKTYFAPGSQYRYSNSGYAMLAMIVEKVSRISFAKFLKKNIFTPLRMTNTIAFEDGISVVKNRAYGYSNRGDHFEQTDQSMTSSVLGDGGIYSSIEDLFKWDQALYTARLVRRSMLKKAFSPTTTTDEPGTSYGFGWRISEKDGVEIIWHSGETIGFRTAIVRAPSKRMTVIVLANRSDMKAPDLAKQVLGFFLKSIDQRSIQNSRLRR